MYLLPLAILPGPLLLWYFRKKDHLNPEPWRYIWITLIISALLVIPVAFIESGLESLTGLSEKGSRTQVLLYAMFVISFVEESSKLLAIRVYAYRKGEFDEPIDGFVYGAASGAGFAILENIFYVLEHGFAVAVMRAFMSVPLHVFTGALIGYGLIRLKLHGSYIRIVLLFMLSVVLHGLYDFVLFRMNADSAGVAIAVAAGSVVLLLSVTRFYVHRYQTSNPPEAAKPSTFWRFIWRLTGILLLLTAAFMLLGAWANYSDGKKEDIAVYGVLIVVPAALGIFCLLRSRRYRQAATPESSIQ